MDGSTLVEWMILEWIIVELILLISGLTYWITGMIGAGLLALRYNRDAGGWVLLAFLLGWLAVLLLLCAGARKRRSKVAPAVQEPEAEERNTGINATDKDGWTRLHIFAMRGDIDRARELIEAGADVNAKENLNGWTPLKVAQVNGRQDMAEFIKKAGGV